MGRDLTNFPEGDELQVPDSEPQTQLECGSPNASNSNVCRV